jgi:putative redox protein
MEMTISFEEKKKVNADYKGMLIKTDQSVASGGEGTAPEPFTLFLASIGTCAGIYVKSFCDQRNIPTGGIKLTQSMKYDPARKLIERISIEIQLPSDFPEKYKEAVIKAADVCTVKRHLADPPLIEVVTRRIQ